MSEKLNNPCFGCTMDGCVDESGVACDKATGSMPADGKLKAFTMLVVADVRKDDMLQVMRELQAFLNRYEKSGLLVEPRGYLGRASARWQLTTWPKLTDGGQ